MFSRRCLDSLSALSLASNTDFDSVKEAFLALLRHSTLYLRVFTSFLSALITSALLLSLDSTKESFDVFSLSAFKLSV